MGPIRRPWTRFHQRFPPLDSWQGVAREREEAEVAWYDRVLEADLDGDTRGIVDEIRASEVFHAKELGGKWMPA